MKDVPNYLYADSTSAAKMANALILRGDLVLSSGITARYSGRGGCRSISNNVVRTIFNEEYLRQLGTTFTSGLPPVLGG